MNILACTTLKKLSNQHEAASTWYSLLSFNGHKVLKQCFNALFPLNPQMVESTSDIKVKIQSRWDYNVYNHERYITVIHNDKTGFLATKVTGMIPAGT